MSRIRTIKPEFFTSEDITEMSFAARLFYQALWCEADREGRLNWKPKTLKQRYFPADDVDINSIADELITHGHILIYEVDGKQYAHLPTFKDHQVINNKEKCTILPEPINFIDACKTRESGVQGEGKGKEGKGRELVVVNTTTCAEEKISAPLAKVQKDSGFAEFFDAYPAKSNKKRARDVWISKNLHKKSELIIADVNRRKERHAKWKEGFVPHASTYLNGERWEDEIVEESKNAARTGTYPRNKTELFYETIAGAFEPTIYENED